MTLRCEQGLRERLAAAGLRATEARLTLLETLEKSPHPVSIKHLGYIVGTVADPVTIYRTLQSFEVAGLVRRTDLHKGHALFELTYGRPHHHHLVCNSCGKIEDIADCPLPSVETTALKYSKEFVSVTDHSMELFGTCKRCVATP